jgi:hypothetical protein
MFPAAAAEQISGWPMVAHAHPVLFGIVSSAGHPIITCFGVTPADARIQKAAWLKGDRSSFAQHAMTSCWARAPRSFCQQFSTATFRSAMRLSRGRRCENSQWF